MNLCTTTNRGKRPLNPLPRSRGPFANQVHLVYDLVVFRSFVSSNGLAVIRDIEDPEPAIEADLSITGIRARVNVSRFWTFEVT
jgi:hypothetical protein